MALCALLAAACSSAHDRTSCGPGTVRIGESCELGDAGALDDAGSLRCGPGTIRVGDTCLPEGTDAGARDGGSAVVDAGSRDAGRWPLVCGPGTHEEDGVCLPDAPSEVGYFDVRVPGTTIRADGFSAIPVFVIGRDTAGAPYLGPVTLSLSRTSAGRLDGAMPTLTLVGATTYFVPCSAIAPDCVGLFEIQLALPSAPDAILASSGTLALVASEGVGTMVPCEGGGNVVFLDGDAGDYIHAGRSTIRAATWSTSIDGTVPTTVNIHVDPDDGGTDGLWWDLDFSSAATGTTLLAQVYEDAEREPFASTGHPGLEVTGDGRGCNRLTGRFQIHRLETTGSTLTRFAATFEQHCEGGVPALRGCVSIGP